MPQSGFRPGPADASPLAVFRYEVPPFCSHKSFSQSLSNRPLRGNGNPKFGNSGHSKIPWRTGGMWGLDHSSHFDYRCYILSREPYSRVSAGCIGTRNAAAMRGCTRRARGSSLQVWVAMAFGAPGAQLITTAVLLLGGGGAAEPRSCSGPIQPDLRYNCSDRASDTPGTSGGTLGSHASLTQLAGLLGLGA